MKTTTQLAQDGQGWNGIVQVANRMLDACNEIDDLLGIQRERCANKRIVEAERLQELFIADREERER